MALFYVAAGINHFIHPETYQQIMPPWLPWHKTLIIVSGIYEIVSALFLVPLSTRRVAAWLIIILLIGVFPANIQMMLNYYQEENPKLWISIVRLPLQLLLIWWAYGFTKKNYYSKK